MKPADRGFDFNQYVQEFVLNFLETSPKVKDKIAEQAKVNVSNLASSLMEDQAKELVKLQVEQDNLNGDFDNFEDRIIEVEDDIANIQADVQSLEKSKSDLDDLIERVEFIEKGYALQDDTDDLTVKIEKLTKLMEKYQPLLDLLNTAAPYLKKFGVIKDIPKLNPKQYWFYHQPEQKSNFVQ